MIVIITGASHTGKTALAQRLLEKYKYPYLSIDHLKMGLIRSKSTDLTPTVSQDDLTAYLWPIVSEMIKTAIENAQNLIVEGCYIPLDWKNSFSEEYLKSIRFFCLTMSEDYIREHFDEIKKYAGVIESRRDDTEFGIERMLEDNEGYRAMAEQCGADCILIDKTYKVDIEL